MEERSAMSRHYHLTLLADVELSRRKRASRVRSVQFKLSVSRSIVVLPRTGSSRNGDMRIECVDYVTWCKDDERFRQRLQPFALSAGDGVEEEYDVDALRTAEPGKFDCLSRAEKGGARKSCGFPSSGCATRGSRSRHPASLKDDAMQGAALPLNEVS